MTGTGFVQGALSALILAQGVRVLRRAGRPDRDQWMGIDLSNRAVAYSFASLFFVIGSLGLVLAFVAPGPGR